jgi:hypothetical protein
VQREEGVLGEPERAYEVGPRSPGFGSRSSGSPSGYGNL